MHWRGEFFFALFLYLSIFLKRPVNNHELLSLDDGNPDNKPIALLIEDSPRNFRNVLGFLQSVSSENHDFWLITFNSSGVSSVWEKSLNNIDKFFRTLELLASESNSEYNIKSNKSLPIFAILNTARIMPNNGSIIVFSGSFLNIDSHLENVTLNSILNKNLTVYTVSDNNALLQNIREYSGGKILNVNAKVKHEEYTQNIYTEPNNVSIILSKKNLMGINELLFPIDHDVAGIHITVKPSASTSGVLTSPSGYRLLLSKKIKSSTIRYSQGSIFENENELFEVHFNFTASGRPSTGIWILKLENMKEAYNVSVFAFTNIETKAHIHLTNEKNIIICVPNINGDFKDVMKLGVKGNISHITHISVLDSNGETLLDNLNYKPKSDRLKYVTENVDNVPDIENKEVHVEIDKLQHRQPFYALIRGKDFKGKDFQRLSYIYAKNDLYPQQSITVEVGLGSELIIASGTHAEVYFEVTNQASSAQIISFKCSDSKYILQSLSIYRKYLEPQESTLVTLYLNPKYGSYRDEITFSVISGLQLIQKKVFVDVGLPLIDQNQPEVTYKYTSDCTGIIFAQCSKGTWRIEITARDPESGLLQLNTIPKGLVFSNAYTSGTTDSVTGYYIESCCNPDLQISAVDRLNNRRSYTVNAYHAKWSPGAIAALVLGILIFIVLVCVITFFVVKKLKPKESYDLPTYRGGGI